MKLDSQWYLYILNIANQKLIYLSSVVYEEVDANFDFWLRRYDTSHGLESRNDSLLVVQLLPLKLGRYVSIVDHDYVSFSLVAFYSFGNSCVYPAEI